MRFTGFLSGICPPGNLSLASGFLQHLQLLRVHFKNLKSMGGGQFDNTKSIITNKHTPNPTSFCNRKRCINPGFKYYESKPILNSGL